MMVFTIICVALLVIGFTYGYGTILMKRGHTPESLSKPKHEKCLANIERLEKELKVGAYAAIELPKGVEQAAMRHAYDPDGSFHNDVEFRVDQHYQTYRPHYSSQIASMSVQPTICYGDPDYAWDNDSQTWVRPWQISNNKEAH